MNLRKLLAPLSIAILMSLCVHQAFSQNVAVFPQMGHSAGVSSVSFSSDGKHILSCSYDGTIKLWDAAKKRELRTFNGHLSAVYAASFSPDGKTIVSASTGGSIKLWDTDTSLEIRNFGNKFELKWPDVELPNGQSVTFSPDGKYIAANYWSNEYDYKYEDNYNGYYRAVKIWNVATGLETMEFSGETGYIAFSPDGKHIITGLRIFDIGSGKKVKTFSEDSSRIYYVSFSPDGKQVVSCHDDGIIKLWDAVSGRILRTFNGGPGRFYSITFSPNGRQIASGSSHNEIKLWDAVTGLEITTFTSHSDQVLSVAFSPDGRQIISGSFNGEIKLWDVYNGIEITNISGHTFRAFSTVFSPDGKRIVFGSNNGKIKFWDIINGSENRTFMSNSGNIISIAISPDEKQLATGSWNESVKLWDTSGGKEIKLLPANFHYNDFIRFSSDGKLIDYFSIDDGIKIWDSYSGVEIGSFNRYPMVLSLDFSKIASSPWKEPIKVQNTTNGREINNFPIDTDKADVLAFSPDGKQIAASWLNTDYDENNEKIYESIIKIWDIATGNEVMKFSFDSTIVSCLEFSPDGKQLVSGSYDEIIRLWNIANGREIRTFKGHIFEISFISFSPNGKYILSGSNDILDRTARLWDCATGHEINVFNGHPYWARYEVFSPDSSKMVSISTDGTVRLWETATGKEIAQFISFTDGEWIAITPDGYYNASPNGDKYLNVRVGNNVYGIDQYRNTFYRPQIVEARLQGRPDPMRIPGTIHDIAINEPPAIVISNPGKDATVSTGQVELAVTVIDQRQPIKSIKVLVNDRLVGSEEMRSLSGTRGLSQVGAGISVTEKLNRIEFRFPVTLTAGANRIEVRAENQFSEGYEHVDVHCTMPFSGRNELPNLRILSIGVNSYKDKQIPNLRYAVNDAKAIVDIFKTQEGRVYRSVEHLLIADGSSKLPTRENIIDGFDWLRRAGERDVKLLFIAGHGMIDEIDGFFFLPYDAEIYEDGRIRTAVAIPARDIQSVLDLPGQKLVFIDACHSEGTSNRMTRGVNNEQLVRSLRNDSSTVIFTSSRGSQTSQEDPKLGHGVFTYCILQGIKGAADLFKEGKVTMKALDLYVSHEVPKLTDGKQEPTTATPDGYINFVIAEIK